MGYAWFVVDFADGLVRGSVGAEFVRFVFIDFFQPRFIQSVFVWSIAI